MIKVDVSNNINKLFSSENFEFLLCERKNGKKFIKVIMYFDDADGYMEIARINPIKNEFIEKGYGDLEHLFHELKDVGFIVSDIRTKIRNKEIEVK